MSSTLEVRHLRLVRALAEEGGPTRAAARLHLSQSAVSHQLAELEARLGVPLFTRVRRRLELTPAGTKLLDTARSLLGELARVERELHRAGERPREPLRLAVESFTSYPFFPMLVRALARESPVVELRISLEATREPVAALLRGTLDLAIVSSPVRDTGLVAVPLLKDEWTVITAPGHRLAKRPYVSAVELGHELLYAPDAPRSDVERLRERIAAERAPMPRVHRIPLTDTLIALVAAGLGVGLVPRWVAAPHVTRGELAARRFTSESLPETWFAVYRRDAEGPLPLARASHLLIGLGVTRRRTAPTGARIGRRATLPR
jgi:LysR family transcriptional regulator for metE and metH